MGFSRQEHWSGVPFPYPGDLPNPGIEPGSASLQADSATIYIYMYIYVHVCIYMYMYLHIGLGGWWRVLILSLDMELYVFKEGLLRELMLAS